MPEAIAGHRQLVLEAKVEFDLSPSSTGASPGVALTAFRADASILFNRQILHLKSRVTPVKKLGSGSRATFVSPYLRRPLRPLDKVLSEREERAEEGTPALPANDGSEALGSVTWDFPRRSASASD